MAGDKTNLRVPFSLKDTSAVIPEAEENGDVSPGVAVDTTEEPVDEADALDTMEEPVNVRDSVDVVRTYRKQSSITGYII